MAAVQATCALRRAVGPGASLTGLPWNLGELEGLIDSQALRDAAVLIPVVQRAHDYSVLLTVRSAALKHHGGQISFPGGRVEPGDRDAVAAALRETEEEIGIGAAQIEILGPLDPLATITGFKVLPVLGLIERLPPLTLDANEVASVFEVPLDFLLDRSNQQRMAREFGGRMRHYHLIEYGPHQIWGATASILVNLTDRLERAARDG